MNRSATLNLDKSFFSPREKLFIVHGKLKACLFLYDSDVHDLRIEKDR